MSIRDTYTLAHTVRCKLQIAADRPDRNLRFILGHAFTLDKLRLRLAEIEMDDSDDDDFIDQPSAPGERRVSFTGNSGHHNNRTCGPITERKRSPPPNQITTAVESESESSDEEYADEEEDNDLSLQRFESATAHPPRMVDDDDSSSSSSDEDEQTSPSLKMPSEEDLKMITDGSGDTELVGLYQHVAGCPCHGAHAPAASNIWEVPRKPGDHGPRVAVVQVED